jgi:ABC-type uncharacterized transport system permease subunit
MTATALSAIFASLLYIFASALILFKIQSGNDAAIRSAVIRVVLPALFAHGFALTSTLWIDEFIYFNLGNGLSLVALLGSAILLITHLNKPTETLGIFIYPLAALSTLLPLAVTEQVQLPLELGSHVLMSIAAYSIMGIATAQAILYSVQERNFKAKRLPKLMRSLPPLQVMENTMIQLLSIGFIFLTFALVSGIFFVENLFEQHLIHKTFFAILAWIIYGLFLFGHSRYGWRGQTAVKFTIWAYFALIISYIGTSLILQFVAE